MSISNAQFSRIMHACRGLPFEDQALVCKRLAATPSQTRVWLLASRDEAIRDAADRFFPDLTRHRQASMIVHDLGRVTQFDPDLGDDFRIVTSAQDKRQALTRIAELGGKELGEESIRKILAVGPG